MTIFNLQIFGEDAEQWLSMPIEDKVEWIRKYTNQQDDAIIEEFINNPKISKDKICLTCGEKFKKIIQEEVVLENVNITADVPIKVTLKKSRKK
jgi:hypothetical protein